jgi:solute carrier family 25 (mitochondrial phosphate transporter), member 3
VRAEEGLKGLSLGFGPTIVGYSMQGLGKFGFYELFKDICQKVVGDETFVRNRKVCWALSSACAEVIADVLLCPFEAVKVRIQTSKPGTFPTDFGAAFNKIKVEEGNNGLFKGLVPLWCRQVPYTVVKFVAFEYIVEKFYQKVFTKPKNEYNKAT